MVWRNAVELEMTIGFSDFAEKVGRLYGLRQFYRMCLPAEGCDIALSLGALIVLSKAGEEVFDEVKRREPNDSDEAIKSAIFITFYHHDVLVDVDETDADLIAEVIGKAVREQQISFPWIFQTVLYDRFFDMFPNQTRKLSDSDTVKLLDGVQTGVFQQAKYIVGPLGILESYSYRSLDPTLSPMLWSCSDPGCQALHNVDLTPRSTRSHALSVRIRAMLERTLGGPSEWPVFLRSATGGHNRFYSSMNTEQLPWLVANSFVGEEQRELLCQLLKDFSADLRRALPQANSGLPNFKGSAEQIAARLDPQQMFQIILVAHDEWIVEAIETLIDSGKIAIPATEVRTPQFAPIPGSHLDVTVECSQFGVRFVPQTKPISLSRFRSLVTSVYDTEADSDTLQFRLRHIPGNSVEDKLDQYLHEEDPSDAVSKLLFDSPSRLRRTSEVLKYGHFEIGSNPSEEERLVNRILWKLGFEVPLYPEYQQLFWNRLERFQEAASTNRPYGADDQEAIRSAGINFFVSLEEILDYALSFSTWMLMSDHYAVTNWSFRLDEARELMANLLNGRTIGKDHPLEMDGSERNSLFPLIEGFDVLCGLCAEILATADLYERPKYGFPGYYGISDVEEFPFVHTKFLLDLRSQDVGEVMGLLSNTTKSLNAANVANVRNRLGHRRSDFPTQAEIYEACSKVATTIRRLEDSGLCPTVYWRTQTTVDKFSRATVELKSQRGAVVVFRTPSRFRASRLPALVGPLIVVPVMHIGGSGELVRFDFSENSPFAQFWSSFPKLKARVGDPVEATDSPEEREKIVISA